MATGEKKHPDWLVGVFCKEMGLDAPQSEPEFMETLSGSADLAAAWKVSCNVFQAFESSSPERHNFLLQWLLRVSKPPSVEDVLRQLLRECLDADGAILRPAEKTLGDAKRALAASYLLGEKSCVLQDQSRTRRCVQKTASEVLDHIRTFKGVKSDLVLGEIFGVTQSTVASWRSRGSLPYKEIIQFCVDEGISLDDLFLSDQDRSQPGT